MKTNWLSMGGVALGVSAIVSALYGESIGSSILLVGMWITFGFSRVVDAISAIAHKQPK